MKGSILCLGGSFAALLFALTGQDFVVPCSLLALYLWLRGSWLVSNRWAQRLKTALLPCVPVLIFGTWYKFSFNYDGFLSGNELVLVSTVLLGSLIYLAEILRSQARSLLYLKSDKILFGAEACWILIFHMKLVCHFFVARYPGHLVGPIWVLSLIAFVGTLLYLLMESSSEKLIEIESSPRPY